MNVLFGGRVLIISQLSFGRSVYRQVQMNDIVVVGEEKERQSESCHFSWIRLALWDK